MGDHISPAGGFDARYVAFLETISQLRPRLHRYCSRMTGSVLDGEDVVQDALFEAYRKLDQFDDSRPVASWVFRIAHNRCVDFLRRKARDTAEVNVSDPESIPAAGTVSLEIRPAIERLVLTLPPKERACVLLKEVFEYSLEEIAELIGSSVGAVKSALNRGRSKLNSTPPPPQPSRKPDPELKRVLKLYIERFNRRDWDGLRELISADAQLRVADAFRGRFADSPYFSNYERWSMPWKLGLADVEDETVVVVLRRDVDTVAGNAQPGAGRLRCGLARQVGKTGGAAQHEAHKIADSALDLWHVRRLQDRPQLPSPVGSDSGHVS
jgi:RNA polymerase sigma-70 factor, ECF subfamily